MANQQPYKLIQGTHTSVQNERRVRIEPGAVFVPSDAEIKAFGDRLQQMEENNSLTINPNTSENGEGTGEESEQTQDPQNDGSPGSQEQNPITESGGEGESDSVNSEEASGDTDSDQDEWPKHTGSGWYELPNGEKVQGKEKAEEEYKTLIEDQSAE